MFTHTHTQQTTEMEDALPLAERMRFPFRWSMTLTVDIEVQWPEGGQWDNIKVNKEMEGHLLSYDPERKLHRDKKGSLLACFSAVCTRGVCSVFVLKVVSRADSNLLLWRRFFSWRTVTSWHCSFESEALADRKTCRPAHLLPCTREVLSSETDLLQTCLSFCLCSFRVTCGASGNWMEMAVELTGKQPFTWAAASMSLLVLIHPAQPRWLNNSSYCSETRAPGGGS